MRRVSLLVLILLTALVSAVGAEPQRGRQRETAPAAPASPRVTAQATIDGCEITIEYGQPSKRGRVIWGGLRPWDVWWMPGADRSTSITTSAPLLVGDLKMPAGVHSLYTLPGETSFLLIINNEVGQFHTVYHPNRDLGRTPMTLTMLTAPVEPMTFALIAHPEGGGTLRLIWDDREYAVTIGRAPADQK